MRILQKWIKFMDKSSPELLIFNPLTINCQSKMAPIFKGSHVEIQ